MQAASVAEAVIAQHPDLVRTDNTGAGEVRVQLTDASDTFLRVTSAILGREPEHLELVNLASRSMP